MAIATKRILGVASVKLGDIETDGGMSLSLAALGDTVRDSVLISNTEGTKQEFFIEESDDAVESITSTKGATTVVWSTSNTDPATLEQFFGGTAYAGTGVIATHGSITGGSSYVNGTYSNVPLTGGTGTGARATIVVAGGAVTTVTITKGGAGYTVADSLSASNTYLGGAGTGFATPVATLTTVSPYWDAPDTIPDIELSVEITDQKGNIVKIARAKISAKMSLNFKRTALGVIDITATVLVPNKAGEPSMRISKIAA